MKRFIHLNAKTFARMTFGVLLFASVSIMITSCIGPEITDQEWQGRDNIQTRQPTTPAPPEQWDYRSWEMSN
jgi:hypothetical protein